MSTVKLPVRTFGYYMLKHALVVTLKLYSIFLDGMNCTIRHSWPTGQNMGVCSIFNPHSIGFEETSTYWSVQFFSLLLIGRH